MSESLASAKGQRVRTMKMKKDYMKLIRKAIKKATETTRMRLFGYVIGAGSPVPIDKGDLRLSVKIKDYHSPKGYVSGLDISWHRAYAEILVQWGIEGSHSARTPGTTLLYPQAVKPVMVNMFVEELNNAIREARHEVE